MRDWKRLTVVVALLALGACPSGVAAQTAAVSGRFAVGGHSLFLDCVGSASPVVVFEGGAGVWSIFYRHLQQRLMAEARTCVYDRAGLGMSDAGPAPRTASRMADELHRLLHVAGERPPFVMVGHSLGGFVVRIYQRRHAHEVSALVLLESAHPDQWRRLPPEVAAVVRGAPEQFRAVAEAAAAGQWTASQLDPWPFQRHGREHRHTYERAMLVPEPWVTTAAEFEAAEESAREVPLGDLGDLPLVVVTAGRSFDAFAGTPIPIEAANAVWQELQRELTGLSTAAVHLVSEASHHMIEQTDPDLVVEGVRRALVAARRRAVEPPAATSTRHRLPHVSTAETDRLLAGLEEAYRRMDVDAWTSRFTSDVEQLDVNRRVLLRGLEAWRRQTEEVNGRHVWMERIHHGRVRVGDRVIVEIEWAGGVRGEALGNPGQDREYRYTGLGILTLEEGRIRSQLLYGDSVSLAEQLGLGEQPAWTVMGAESRSAAGAGDGRCWR